MDKFFKISERGSSYKTETIAGISTFLSMCYIIIVNPLILADAGMDPYAVFTATIITSAVGCIVMALYANLPIGVMPGMGMNAFFTYTVVIVMGYSWEEALFALFISSILFFIISITGIRKAILRAIPPVLRSAISVGIGMFITFIGLQSIGVIVASEATLVTIGNFMNPVTALGLIGIILTLVLLNRKVPAAIFLGMIIMTVVGLFTQLVLNIDLGIVMPSSLISMPPSINETFMAAFTVPDIPALLTDFTFWFIIFSMLFVDFFDTTGSIIGYSKKLGLVNEETGDIEGADRIMVADSVAIGTGAVLGTSSTATVVESMVGVEMGARTGFSALVIAGCFLLSLFLSPLLAIVGPYVTAPALVCVGIFMIQHVADIDFSSFKNSAVAFITITMTVLTYSISEGIAMGVIVYTILTFFERDEKAHPIMYILSGILLIHYIV